MSNQTLTLYYMKNFNILNRYVFVRVSNYLEICWLL